MHLIVSLIRPQRIGSKPTWHELPLDNMCHSVASAAEGLRTCGVQGTGNVMLIWNVLNIQEFLLAELALAARVCWQ